MALDKQKILNELGSVLNQLKSAECGCMGKLFNNPAAAYGAGSMNTGQGHGGCGHGCHYHSHGSGHDYSTPRVNDPRNMTHCMAQCNPPKLYADTYNYLNKTLMQPVVSEVYNEIKSINPQNTIMNDPAAKGLGLTQAANFAPVNQTPDAMPQMPDAVQQNAHVMQNAQMFNAQMPNTQMYAQQHQQNAQMPVSQQQNAHMQNAQMPVAQQQNSYNQNAQIPTTPFQDTTDLSHLLANKIDSKMATNVTQQKVDSRIQEATAGMGPRILNMMNAPSNKPVNPTLKVGQVPEKPVVADAKEPVQHIGDVQQDLKPDLKQDYVKQDVQKKCRNGLQDMVFTAAPTSAAWSFHGDNMRSPFSTNYRFRNRT